MTKYNSCNRIGVQGSEAECIGVERSSARAVEDNQYRTWTRVRPDDYWYAKVTDLNGIPGLYAIFGDGKLVYVGQSKSIGYRLWKGHCIEPTTCEIIAWQTPWGVFDELEIAFREIPKYRYRLYREGLLIDRLRPTGNKTARVD